MLVDIVIPTFNQLHFIKKCYTALARNTKHPYRVYFSDDRSDDDALKDWLLSIQLLGRAGVFINPKRLGFAANCNSAVARTNAPLICLLNQDTEPQKGWLSAMCAALELDDTIGIVGAKMLFPPGKPDLAGKIQHLGVARKKGGVPYHKYRESPADIPQAVVKRYVNAVTAACMLVKRECWDQLGGFDEEFAMGNFEDIDFNWRARDAGWKIVMEPKAVLLHYEHGSGENYVREGHDQNRARLLRKWHHLESDEHLFD